MTDDEVRDLFERARDEGACLSLALLEFLKEKKHSTGAVRVMAPYLTETEAKQVVAMSAEILRKRVVERAQERKDQAARIVVAPSGLLVPPGNLPR